MTKRNWLVLVAIALTICGLFAVYSVDPLRDEGFSLASFHGRQTLWAAVGWLLFWLIARKVEVSRFFEWKWALYILMILALVAVLLFGEGDEAGVRRWLFSKSVQPSEFAKLAFSFFLAAYLAEREEEFGCWSLFLKTLFLTGIPAFLIYLEPDLGTALVLVIIWFVGLLLSGFSARKILGIVALLVALFSLSWPFLKDYQKARLLVFINPQRDPLGSGYNVIQSLIAIGAGGFLGKGFLAGSQSQLRFLPAAYTDFIFASWCEQFGFVGGFLIIVLLSIMLYLVFSIARSVPELEGKFAVVFLGSILLFQSTVNIAMNLGWAPVTGIPLPFVSYGGSSLMMSLLSIAFIYRIAARSMEGE
jgi:rod shape determining protein RodA